MISEVDFTTGKKTITKVRIGQKHRYFKSNVLGKNSTWTSPQNSFRHIVIRRCTTHARHSSNSAPAGKGEQPLRLAALPSGQRPAGQPGVLEAPRCVGTRSPLRPEGRRGGASQTSRLEYLAGCSCCVSHGPVDGRSDRLQPLFQLIRSTDIWRVS